MGEAEASLEDEEDSDDEDDESEGEEDSSADGEGEAEVSEVSSLFVVVEVEDFLDGVADVSALALELFFVVVELPEPEELVPVFFVVEEVVLLPPLDVFFDVIELLALVEVAVFFLFAHAVTKASAARIVNPNSKDFFIGVRASSLSQLPAAKQAFNRSTERNEHDAGRDQKRADEQPRVQALAQNEHRRQGDDNDGRTLDRIEKAEIEMLQQRDGQKKCDR